MCCKQKMKDGTEWRVILSPVVLLPYRMKFSKINNLKIILKILLKIDFLKHGEQFSHICKIFKSKLYLYKITYHTQK